MSVYLSWIKFIGIHPFNLNPEKWFKSILRVQIKQANMETDRPELIWNLL